METALTAAAGSTASWLGWLGHAVSSNLGSTEVQVLMTTLTIIWLGAHASIRRPPSAAPIRSPTAKAQAQAQEDDHDDDDRDKFTEGFVASDAILFPVLAGSMLVGLYYLLQWLQDPNMLSKLLCAYLSLASIVGLSALSADFLDLLVSLVLPDVWVDRRNNRLYRIDPARRRQVLVDPVTGAETVVADKISPLPGSFLSRASSKRAAALLWHIRSSLTERWTVHLNMSGVGRTKIRIRFSRILGIAIAVSNMCGYWLTDWPVLSNLMGSSLSYSSFRAVSATSVSIGSMVLCGLFVYDIVMVFYTPYMMTVATKIDAPIKLVFKSMGGGASSVSMLGLGDIVVPGLIIGLALRFDLYMHYVHKIAHAPVKLSSAAAGHVSDLSVKIPEEDQQSHLRVKAPFVDPRGQLGNRLWTMGNPWSAVFGPSTPHHPVFAAPASAPSTQQRGSQNTSHSSRPPVVSFAASFPKPYFYASICGYVLGMLATLVSLHVSRRGQPALLYLVPGVVGAVWLTAAIRGDLHQMLLYTEDGSLDTKDVLCELDPLTGRIVKTKSSEVGGVSVEGKEETQLAGEGTGGEDEEAPGRTSANAGPEESSLAQGLRLRTKIEK